MKVNAINLSEQYINDHKALINSVITELEKIFTFIPPAGERELVIFHRSKPDDTPICDPTQDINYYFIGLTVIDQGYAQIAFQLSHELCHIYCDARRTNRFIECVCEMLSILCLNRLAQTWSHSPPFHNWKDYAPSFAMYANNRLSDAHRQILHLENPTIHDNAQWIQKNKYIFNTNLIDHKSRLENTIVAESLLPLFLTVSDFEIFKFYSKAGIPSVDKSKLLEWTEYTEIDYSFLESIIPYNCKSTLAEVIKLIL